MTALGISQGIDQLPGCQCLTNRPHLDHIVFALALMPVCINPVMRWSQCLKCFQLKRNAGMSCAHDAVRNEAVFIPKMA